MSEPTFTPGPWHATESGFIYDASRHQIAEVFSGKTWSMRENGHLIAAAPTMYEYIESSAMNGCATARKILEAINGNA